MFFPGNLSLKIFIYSFQRIISWEEIAPVKFSTSSRGNPGKKQSLLHLPKNTRRREGVALVDPKNPFPLQYPKGTSACPPASHCPWRPLASGQWWHQSLHFLCPFLSFSTSSFMYFSSVRARLLKPFSISVLT